MKHVVLLDEVPGYGRVILRAGGPDAERFLQGLLSADLTGLRGQSPPQAVAASVLTVKGGLVSEVIVAPAREGFYLLLPADVAQAVTDKLNKHIIMDDVTLETLETTAALCWPDAPDAPDGVEAFETRHPAPGQLLIGERSSLQGLATSTDATTLEAHRISTASPAWGRELKEGRLPPELGFAYAVSYDKGCFMGQEPLARIHARGQVNRVLVTVTVDGEMLGEEAVKLSHADREKAGEWTSAVEHEGKKIGLALIHRTLAVVGTKLAADNGATLTVSSGPMGDDPGIAGKAEAKAARAVLRGN